MIRSGITFLLLLVWNASHSSIFLTPGDEDYSVKKICVSKDGKNLFSINNKTLDIWDLERTEIIKKINCGSSTLLCISYSDTRNIIVLGNHSGEVIIINPNYEQNVIKLEGSGFVSAVLVTNDGLTVYAGTEEGMIYKLDASEGNILNKVALHNDVVTSLAYRLSSDQLISSGADGSVKISKGENLTESEIIQKGNGWIRDLCLSKDESILVTGNDTGKIHRYNISSDGDYKLINKSGQFSTWITGVNMVENDMIACSSFSGNIRINFKFGSYRKKIKHRINDLCLIPMDEDEHYIQLAIATDDNGVIFLDSREMKLKPRK